MPAIPVQLHARGVAARCCEAVLTYRFAGSNHSFDQEAIMNKRKLAKSLVAIALLGVGGIVGAESYYHHQATGDNATQAEQKAPANQTIGSRAPWAEMQRIQTQMDQLFEEAMQQFHSDPFFRPLAEDKQLAAEPKVMLQDEKDHYVITADIPGTRAESIDVGLSGQLLTISAETLNKQQQSNDKGQVVKEESYISDFEQALTLPGPVTASGMHSDYHDGVLTVTIPKVTS
jgi:HSP20 family protein